MKIVFLSFYSGELYRGVETFIHELANRLILFGNDIAVYQNGPTVPGARYVTKTIGLDVDWKHKKSYAHFTNYYSLRIRDFTKQVLKDIGKDTDIIFPTNGDWETLFCSLWAKWHRKKVIISGQSGPGADDKINLFTFPDAFVALTEFQKKWAKRANPFVRIEKIPNGVDIVKFSKNAVPIKTNLQRPIILSVAAFDPWKRLDLTIKALAKLDKGSLLLVGRGEKEKELKALGESLLGGRFQILSFPHQEMPGVYAAADLFAYPTVPWESFGIVLVEAMANNLAVVANDDPIRREIVGDAGFFVDPTDADGYARVLEKALNTNWGNKPRQQAEKFSWDKIAEKYEEIFRSLIK